jgi:ParB family chromosome partitioning protein
VRETEQLVKSFKEPTSGPAPEGKKGKKELPDFAAQGLGAIKDHLAAKVDISASPKGKGKIVIPFHSEEEFRRIKKLLTGG